MSEEGRLYIYSSPPKVVEEVCSQKNKERKMVLSRLWKSKSYYPCKTKSVTKLRALVQWEHTLLLYIKLDHCHILIVIVELIFFIYFKNQFIVGAKLLNY